MGSIKDRNGRDLTEAEDIKKRWQETQKNCTKKIFMALDNHTDQSPIARHPGVQRQVGLGKYRYK